MLSPQIAEFARLLVRQVRDRAIESMDGQNRPNSESPFAKRLREAAANLPPTSIAEMIIPECIDDAVFYLLEAIDSGALHLSFVAASGEVVDLTDEGQGELAGWYYGVRKAG
jgi:hypothetical protein